MRHGDVNAAVVGEDPTLHRLVNRSSKQHFGAMRVLTKCSKSDQSRGGRFALRQRTGMALRKPRMILEGSKNPNDCVTT